MQAVQASDGETVQAVQVYAGGTVQAVGVCDGAPLQAISDGALVPAVEIHDRDALEKVVDEAFRAVIKDCRKSMTKNSVKAYVVKGKYLRNSKSLKMRWS